ncbi:hypothetical protein [Streptomyces sp. BA2]|uniref:hypothetical protein n=1 Tax=Streptomyces sp. BA2 TaxID=436595 RepID=UPI00132145C3|nr:hypothetical protein [Streptomyces sp. BA2]MWA15177.1 hypothetical protein [Streptomyces sp. BA2]
MTDTAPPHSPDPGGTNEPPRRVAGPTSGNITITTMHGGAVASGPGAQAVHTTNDGVPLGRDTAALLAAIHTLRDQLPLLAPSAPGPDSLDPTLDLDGQLARVEEEIATTGRPDQGRLERLRAHLETGTSAAGGLASAVAVVQAIVQLLSG